MTTTKALAKLYKTIVGSEGRNSAAKILSDLADNWTGGGGGDSSDFFRIKFSTSDMTNFTCDKTFAEMKAARDAGKYFIATNEASLTVGGTTIEGTTSLDTWGYSSQTNMFTFLQADFSEDVDQNIVASISVITVSSTDVIVGKLLSGAIQP